MLRGYEDALNLTLQTTDIPEELWLDPEYRSGYHEGMKFFMPH